jgi:hypothetical protein
MGQIEREGVSMIHGRKDYTRRIQDKENKIPDDEPVFLIRGQDQVGHNAVRAWAHLHRINGGSDMAYLLAMQHADLMESWAKKHSKPADTTPDQESGKV